MAEVQGQITAQGGKVKSLKDEVKAKKKAKACSTPVARPELSMQRVKCPCYTALQSHHGSLLFNMPVLVHVVDGRVRAQTSTHAAGSHK